MLNGIFQRPYLNNNKNLVKQDEERSASTQEEQQSNQNSKSKGLQYVEQNRSAYKNE